MNETRAESCCDFPVSKRMLSMVSGQRPKIDTSIKLRAMRIESDTLKHSLVMFACLVVYLSIQIYGG